MGERGKKKYSINEELMRMAAGRREGERERGRDKEKSEKRETDRKS